MLLKREFFIDNCNMDPVKQSYRQRIALDAHKAEGGYLSSTVFRRNNTARLQKIFQVRLTYQRMCSFLSVGNEVIIK